MSVVKQLKKRCQSEAVRRRTGAATLSRVTQGVGLGFLRSSKAVRRAYAVQVKGLHQTFGAGYATALKESLRQKSDCPAPVRRTNFSRATISVVAAVEFLPELAGRTLG
jgi:hypothetical protein